MMPAKFSTLCAALASSDWNGNFLMKSNRTLGGVFLTTVLLVLLTACANSADYTPLLSVEPTIGSVLKRPPRNLRLFFDALPDVSQSSLSLQAPDGDHPLRGMHTMGADDLMIEITNPSIPDGEYTVQWTTVVGDDTAVHSGSFGFTVQTD